VQALTIDLAPPLATNTAHPVQVVIIATNLAFLAFFSSQSALQFSESLLFFSSSARLVSFSLKTDCYFANSS
jgi:hypothetical protein